MKYAIGALLVVLVELLAYGVIDKYSDDLGFRVTITETSKPTTEFLMPKQLQDDALESKTTVKDGIVTGEGDEETGLYEMQPLSIVPLGELIPGDSVTAYPENVQTEGVTSPRDSAILVIVDSNEVFRVDMEGRVYINGVLIDKMDTEEIRASMQELVKYINKPNGLTGTE